MAAQDLMTAKPVRVLPLATAPLPGESLDSWLEAIAVRMDVTMAELYEHMGFRSPYSELWRHINRKLTSYEAGAIATATGYRVEDISAMTLARYPADVVGIDFNTGEFIGTAPWARVHGSRFCPRCLGSTGGGWQLNWRLIWTFACLQHRCLLADRCPCCGAAQRYRYRIGDEHPCPGQCANSADGGGIGRTPRCAADLAQAHVLDLPVHHPVLLAQSAINDLLDRDTVSFGIYAQHPQPVSAVLADLRALGGGILAATPPHHLGGIVSPDLAEHYEQLLGRGDVHSAHKDRYGRRLKEKPPLAVSTAVAVTAAMAILNHRNLSEAADAVTALHNHLDRHILEMSLAAQGGVSGGASPVLRAVHTIALGVRLTSVEQLRRRLGTTLPGRPIDNTARAERRLRCTPTLLWPAWSLRLCPPTSFQRTARPALAPTILLVNTTMRIKDAAVALGEHVTYQSVIQMLWHLTVCGYWDAIRSALIRLADYLDSHGSPIDYQRRRRLDCTGLLPETRWLTLARTNTTRPEGASTARNFLRQRISGVPAIATPVPSWDYDAYGSLLRFPVRLNPELLNALDDHALEFLAAQGITDEPVYWEPPMTLINDLTLPGIDVDAIDTNQLHHLVRKEQLDIAAAAARIGISTDAVRVALERRPAHRDPKPGSRPRIGPHRARAPYLKAMSVLPKEKFAELYLQQHRSLRDLAAIAGVSKPTISELARDYAIPLRAPHACAKHVIDRDWLITEYTTNHRSYADLAHELNVSVSVIANRVKEYGIESRGVGWRTVEDVRANGAIPALLITAVVGQGGWERLQHFVAAVEHLSYTNAAQHLGMHRSVLSQQIRRIERDLGHRLVEPATDCKPLKLTHFGRVVCAAVQDLAANGGP
ncbi:TniQ family protein [Mycobacterium sp. DBP42]|uniref:TniQ family protein n=1 Tax=Mycobacterium sp. DBP42 TaxID=2545267 RepID=UPI001485DAAD|nr:TniQ family protein [Mycobacterium sp. DBP42]